uniref:Sphingomyelin phosphodiesterase n=1 Tax=Culex tarsalis TaxID=7177 RepID=A0A1Q3FB46_CULTA
MKLDCCCTVVCILLLTVTSFVLCAENEVPCTIDEIAMAEKYFNDAFAAKFDVKKMSADSKKLMHCLKDKNATLKLTEIPKCHKPRYCLLCRVAIHTLITTFKQLRQVSHQLKPGMMQVTQGLCRLAEHSDEYCADLIKLYLDSIIEILQTNDQITPNEVCSMPLGPIGCVQEPSGSPIEPVKLADFNFKSTVSVAYSKTWSTKILLITDVHYDPAYVGGLESEQVVKQCKKQYGCCRVGNTARPKETFWGNYNHCDTPKTLLEASLKQIAEQHPDAKMVYLTGDLVRHHVTELNFETLKADADFVLELFMKTFKNIPIVLAIGNHDTDVFGMFSPGDKSSGYGQSKVYKYFQNWVEKLWKNGQITRKPRKIEWPANGETYYSIPVKERLRLIVLNSNVAYMYNWWLLAKPHFYRAQLQWLQDTLARAEQEHQNVHILSHIAPNHFSLLPGWSREFQRIVERYRNTITAQFNGHSHLSEFALFYDSAQLAEPIGVAWNGGSLTPHTFHNPNFNVAMLESGKFSVSSLESYTIDLGNANQDPSKAPKWELSSNMTAEFNLNDLTLKSLDKLVQKMTKNETLVQQYLRYAVKKGPRSKKELSPECKVALLCGIVATNGKNKAKCENLLKGTTWNQGSGICVMDVY